jgi:hypothetical protein
VKLVKYLRVVFDGKLIEFMGRRENSVIIKRPVNRQYIFCIIEGIQHEIHVFISFNLFKPDRMVVQKLKPKHRRPMRKSASPLKDLIDQFLVDTVDDLQIRRNVFTHRIVLRMTPVLGYTKNK